MVPDTYVPSIFAPFTYIIPTTYHTTEIVRTIYIYASPRTKTKNTISPFTIHHQSLQHKERQAALLT